MPANDGRPVEVVGVGRKAGGLFRITTSDGRRYLVADDPSAAGYLEKGAVLHGPDIDDLEGPRARAAGLIFACALLSRRDRTESQIRSALAAEGIEDPETVGHILGSLRAKGYVDDRRYAEETILTRKRYRPTGPGFLRRMLREAGVAAEVVEDSIERHYPGADEERIARSLAAGKLALMKGVDREKAARRMHAYLSRRGFSPGLVNDICAGVLRGDHTGEGQ
ncbi:MAG: RecX family transcriptional regulator [Candidatus Krumholzibacteria bacterium]|nr:RecX family transcriptional regulator [Candidatus Krumholzibacteria bacterium]